MDTCMSIQPLLPFSLKLMTSLQTLLTSSPLWPLLLETLFPCLTLFSVHPFLPPSLNPSFMLCFPFVLQDRAASYSLPRLFLPPPLCRLAQSLVSPSLFASLWHPACWCPNPKLSCLTSCPLRLSRRAALRGCSRYKHTHKHSTSSFLWLLVFYQHTYFGNPKVYKDNLSG